MIDHIVLGLVALMISALAGIESSLGDGIAMTGLSHTAQSAFWVVIVVLTLVALVRLLRGWLRTGSVLFLLILIAHAGVTHGLIPTG
jgi:hypothetical protein